MIYLLPIGLVIRLIAVVYAAVIALAVALSWKLGDQSHTVWLGISFAFSGATVLQFALGAWIYLGWRQLWKWFPVLNCVLFPDIGGEWLIEIHWFREGQNGVVHAEATVVQDFVRISMEVKSEKSDSQTLIAQPKKDPELGRPILYYVYLVTPKAVGVQPSQPYHGAAILKFSQAGGGELSGNYWTTKQTGGHFRLLRRPDHEPVGNTRRKRLT